VVFGQQEPHVSFVSKKGIYLSSKGDKNVGIKIINIPKINVSVYKIYANNILSYLRSNNSYYYYDYYDDYYYDYGYGSGSLENYGDLVMEKQYDTKSLKGNNGVSLLNLNFDDINTFKGIYYVKVNSTENQWIKDSKMISISDIGMIVKETEDDIIVFANSILSANPIDKAEISLISSNNQNVYKATTDANGVARFEDIKKKAPGFRIKMLTAQAGEDFNYIHFDQTRVETSRFNVGGARSNPSGYQTFIYGDREIYRPGETVNINTIVRDQEWGPLKEAPVKIRVILPNGKEFTSKKGNLNSQGAFTTSFQLPTGAVTGSYNIEVYSANDVLLTSKSISVEEFMPDRIKVEGKLNKTQLTLDEELKVSGVATNLFGPPAAGRNFEVEVTLKRKEIYPKGLGNYIFSLNGNMATYFENKLVEGTTDEDGGFEHNFDFSQSYENSGILDGKVYITVFDESGRPVHQVKSFDVITQDVFYGIKDIDNYVDLRQNLQIPIVAVNKDGQLLSNAKGQIQIIKYEWQNVMERNYNGTYRYVSQRKEQVLEDKTITIGGDKTVYNFIPTLSGEYEIRLRKPGSQSYVSQYFYAYGYGYTNNYSFEVNNEGNVDIEFDKDKYEVGEDAKILFKTPFAGKLLVTIERNKVYEYYQLDTDKKSASLKLSLKEEFLPNVYISATLIKPNEQSSSPLTVAHGYAPIFVEKKANKLPLEIIASDKSRSRTKQTIKVKSAPESDIEVTLAVVDEGILQIKNTSTPDPYGYFYQKKALEVKSYDVYPLLLPELSRKSSVAGDGYDLEKRVNPLANKRVKLVSFWSGIIKTNSDGEAAYTIDIPQFSGDLRIMAVAYKNGSFGSTSKNMKVADPVVISTSLPRFLSPGDTVLVPVTLTNTTSSSSNAEASIQTSGPLKVVGSSEQSVSLKANAENQVVFKVVANNAIGEGKITTIVNALNEKFTEATDITVRPASSLVKVNDAGVIEANTTKNISLNSDFIPTSVKSRVIISKSPIIQFADNLDFLLGYPHGCVEQTVAKAFPQIYFNDLVSNIGATRYKGLNPNYNVQEAINKLSTMQLHNGALSYWPGGYYESWWGTIFATHFLMEAKKAGFDVNNNMLDRLYGYLQQKVKEKKLQDYYYYTTDYRSYKVKQIAPKDIFYSLYVLAAAGRQDVAIMNYYKANKNLLAVDSKYLLASTYRMLGDEDSYQSLLPNGFDNEKSYNAFDGSFHSYIRDMAISLNTLIENDPTNAQVGILAKHLSTELKKKRYLSTQENCFAFIALGKLAKKANESNITAEIKAGGKKIGSFEGNTLVLDKGVSGQELSITTKGSGQLYYFYEAEGLSSSGTVKEEDSFIRVRKTFYDRNGNVITSNTFKQNDLVVVKISVSTTDDSNVGNVVITDILPAGFEIENPRLTDGNEVGWIRDQSVPEHFDIRDDRINLFTSVTGYTRHYYYMVRAVSKGTFKMGPVSADAMYNGEYHSYNGAGTIRVIDKARMKAAVE
ncbi:MAG TPA: MG2 domain-containing protein, partial [Cytophagaceae bacterium]